MKLDRFPSLEELGGFALSNRDIQLMEYMVNCIFEDQMEQLSEHTIVSIWKAFIEKGSLKEEIRVKLEMRLHDDEENNLIECNLLENAIKGYFKAFFRDLPIDNVISISIKNEEDGSFLTFAFCKIPNYEEMERMSSPIQRPDLKNYPKANSPLYSKSDILDKYVTVQENLNLVENENKKIREYNAFNKELDQFIMDEMRDFLIDNVLEHFPELKDMPKKAFIVVWDKVYEEEKTLDFKVIARKFQREVSMLIDVLECIKS